MKKLVEETRRVEKIFGNEEFGIRKVEEETQIFRRKANQEGSKNENKSTEALDT